MIKLLLFSFLFISCSSEFELKPYKDLYFIENLDFDLQKLREIDWKVGRKRDKNVSMGFLFEIEIPKISEKSIEQLQEHAEGIDSWVYKVEKVVKGRKQHIAYINYFFNSMTSTVDSFSIKILYHAASVSDAFRRFHCPAFGHRQLLQDLDLKSMNQTTKSLHTTRQKKITQKVFKPSFTILGFSGGQKLEGEYLVSMAFFSSKAKRIYGNFIYANQRIYIGPEEHTKIPSCVGIKEEISPLPESRGAKLRDLKL